jgi:hypothetical protein
VIAALATSTAMAVPAFASPSGDLAAATNGARAAAGLPALSIDGQLSAVAQAWAQHLAAVNTLSHNGALRGQVSNWTYLGENVGMAGDISSVQTAFMNSPEHRANILNPNYTEMGVGSATSTYPSCGCQVLWVVVDFKRPAAAAAPAPRPAPAAPTAPKPAPVQAAQPAPAQHVTAPVQHVTAPVQHVTAPVQHVAAPVQQVAAAVQHRTAAPPASVPSSTPGAPGPSTAASASALGSQLAAAASSPAATTGAGDPVSRLLSFATVMSGLPG